MASNEQRHDALMAMGLEEIKNKLRGLGFNVLKKEGLSKEQVINRLFTETPIGQRNQGDQNEVDRRLGLPTDREQDRLVKLSATNAAERSATAAEDSARSARIALWISVVAVLISIVSLLLWLL